MAVHELVLGGQKSGKSRWAEQRAAAWLAMPERSAVLLATAQPGDEEMRQRIARHRTDRAARVPRLDAEEVAQELPAALRRHAAPHRLVVVDCLTLWLTQALMPMDGPALLRSAWQALQDELCAALRDATGPVVLVSNEIGWGLSPLGRDVRAFVDALGGLHQAVAAHCERVTLLVAGCPLSVKGTAG